MVKKKHETDHSRQDFLCPVENVNKLDILVVGCGAIGRNVASNLARLGVRSITLVDGDIVEKHNIVPQNWSIKDCGRKKVDVLAEEITSQVPDVKVISHSKFWNPKVVGLTEKFHSIWTTVDNIDVRAALYNFFSPKVDNFFDIRIGGTLGQIFNVIDAPKNNWYEKTLFRAAEAARFGCVQPMTNYIANITAGFSVNQFANHYNGKGWKVHKMINFCSISGTASPEDPNEYFKTL